MVAIQASKYCQWKHAKGRRSISTLQKSSPMLCAEVIACLGQTQQDSCADTAVCTLVKNVANWVRLL